MNINLYVVRHCKAEGQQSKAKLTELGTKQAEKLSEFLLHKNIDFIVSSPFERAYRSILPLAKRINIKVVLDDRLIERVLTSEIQPNWLEMLRLTYDDLQISYEGGESSVSAMERGIAVVKEALDSEHKNIVLVSHGNLISLLLKHFDDRIGFNDWVKLSNPDVFHLVFSDKKIIDIKRIWEE